MGWLSRFELPTSRATIWRSNQLNYSHHISYLPYHMDYSSLRPPSIHLVPLQPFPRYDTNLVGRSYIRCHYSLIFVPQMVLRADVTSRSHLILADYPGAADGVRTRDLLNGNQMLYQLSHSRIAKSGDSDWLPRSDFLSVSFMVSP